MYVAGYIYRLILTHSQNTLRAQLPSRAEHLFALNSEVLLPFLTMVVAYSPHRDGSGGTLHLPSPTHIRHTDPSSAIAQLRRSLSRSPSKAPTFRILASKSASPSPSSPLSPSPLSPSHRATPTQPASPLGVPVSASAKKTRNTIRRSSPMRTQAHLLRSPAKRALSESSDNGNATSSSPQESQSKMEGKVDHPQTLKAEQNSQAHHNSSSSNAFLNPTSAFSRRENSEYLNDIAAKSSPLKRSDGSRNFDLAHVGSPSAKRRSLHGASFGPDFDIFDQFAAFESSGGSMNESQGFPESATGSQSPVPRRSSSLRKSTLQQRHDKPVPRSRPEFATFPDCSTPNYSKTRTRMSLDNIPQPSRDSPFSSHGALPSASVHPIRKGLAQANLLPMNQRHPLSRTITQSSSSSSMAEDSPTHAPVKQQNFSRPNVFSKSLPLGSNRPTTTAPPGEESSQESGSFATPENYKLAKPLPAAFMSTGLVSKRNKHIDDSQLNLNESIGHMPDTPCKRPASMAAMSPFAQPKSSLNDHRQSRHTMHSFGTPSTPFNPHASRQSSGFGKGVNIFGSTFNHTRRASFLSDTEDNSQPGNFQTQSSNDFDIPPTPTKQASPVEQTHFGHSHRSNGSFGFRASIRDDPEKSPDANVNSKYNIFIVQERGKDGIEENCVGESPSSQLRFRSVDSIPSFSNRFNDMGQCLSPSRHPRKSLPVPFIRVAKNIKTNPSPLSPASPLLGRSGPKTPRTPSENMVPPDPSGLSISARAESSNQAFNFGSSLNMQPPPATPTANRDSFLHFGGHKASVTPIHQSTAAEVDSSMTSRFDKVELIGAGEFSKVFRVSLKGQSNAQSMLSGDCHSPKSSTSSPVRVWAVKKTRKPYLGPKDRHRKQQEVEILKSLGQSEHTVQLFDSWESDSRLYIQTEFCEEGSLDLFLLRAGRKTRLDDFRIWKILLELSEVRHCMTLKWLY